MDDKQFLVMKKVSKTFPGVKALQNIELEIRKGEIHALIGENGAGKSTLIKILSGIYQPDEGAKIYIDGEKMNSIRPITALLKGIVVIYQDFSLFPNLSVAENIAISLDIEKKKKFINWKRMRKIAKDAITRLGVSIDVDEQLGNLSIAKQQLVAIARALVYDARLIIMDEPTSSLSKYEIKLLFSIMKKIKNSGISIIFISHKLDELFAVSDRFTILRDGKYIGTFSDNELDDDRLISLMVGRNIEYIVYPKRKCTETILEVEGLNKRGYFRDISFSLYKGEVLGITGLVGSGRTELVQSLFGINIPDTGRIILNGQKINVTSPEEAVGYGIAYVPEGRLTEGLVLRKSAQDNIIITNMQKVIDKFGNFENRKKKQLTDEWIEKLDVRPAIPEMLAENMSGGNQQKVILAKWLATKPAILIIDEPTNGIDIGAKTVIHKIIRDLAESGISIILVSSELQEILAICDRILVMKRGGISAEMDGSKVSQADIMNKAVQGIKEKIDID